MRWEQRTRLPLRRLSARLGLWPAKKVLRPSKARLKQPMPKGPTTEKLNLVTSSRPTRQRKRPRRPCDRIVRANRRKGGRAGRRLRRGRAIVAMATGVHLKEPGPRADNVAAVVAVAEAGVVAVVEAMAGPQAARLLRPPRRDNPAHGLAGRQLPKTFSDGEFARVCGEDCYCQTAPCSSPSERRSRFRPSRSIAIRLSSHVLVCMRTIVLPLSDAS